MDVKWIEMPLAIDHQVALSLLPVAKLGATIERNNPGVVVHVLQELLGVLLAVLDEFIVPHHPVGPVDLVAGLNGGVGNGTDFGQSQNPLVVGDGLELLVFLSEDTMVTSIGVVVDGCDITLVVSRIPVSFGGVAYPDHVVEVVEASDAVVDHIPELLERGRTLGTPPKPSTLGLVEGAEENRNIGLIEALDLGSDGIDITQQEAIVGPVATVVDGIGNVEAGGLGVESAVPRLFGVIEQTSRSIPMPDEGVDSVTICVLNHILDGVRLAAVSNRRRRVIHEVATQDRRGDANVLLDPVPAACILLTGNVMRSVLRLNVFQKRFGAGGGRLVDVVVGQTLAAGSKGSRGEEKRKE